jgi:putative peptidoglycan lipid II flippase
MAATALPMYLVTIISSALNVTFIPVFAEYRDKNNKDLWEVVSSFLNISVLITIFFISIIVIEAKPIMKILTPGFNEDKIDLASLLLKWQMPIVILTVVNELMASIYYSNNNFVIPLLNKIISPIVTIIFVLLLSKFISVQSLVFATLIGMFLQTLILAIGFIKDKEFKYSLSFNFKSTGVIKIFKLMLPLFCGMMLYKIMPLFDRFLASKLPEGSISYLGYSFKIFNQIPPIISTGISMSIFPLLATLAANDNWNELKIRMSIGIRFLLFLSVPIVLMISLYSKPIIELVFQHGFFNSSDTLNTSHALSIYIIALPFAVVGEIVSKGFYVLQDTLTPAIIGIFEVIVYILSAFIFLPFLGFLSIPAAYAVYFCFSTINAYFVRRKLGNKGGKKIIMSFFKYSLVSIFSAIMIYLPIRTCESMLLKNIFIFCGFCIYFLICFFILKTEESKKIYNYISREFSFRIF